jgi:hypothetical protein
MKRWARIAVLLVLAWSVRAHAEEKEDEIVTDRPDVAESSETVGAGRFQAELSTVVETDRAGEHRRTGVRTPLKLRVGLIDRLELHLETDGFARDWGRDASGVTVNATGGADLGLGGKVHLFDQRRLLPSTAILLSLTVPTGSAAFSDGNTSLSPTLAVSWDLTRDWSIGANVGATIALSERQDHSDTLRFAVALWRSWAPLSEKLSSFVEPSGEIPLDGSEPAIQLQGGFAYLFTPQLQLDLAVIFGLTSTAADFATTVGLSFKI